MTIHVTQFADGLPRRAFSVADIFRFVEAGVIAEDERFELLGGDIVPMTAKNIRHERVKSAVNFYLADKRRECGFEFAPETTFILSDMTFVEPDFVLYPPGGLEELSPETALLAIEVSDTSLSYDRGRKAGVYALHGVRELWVIDVRSLSLIVHREPAPEGYADVTEHDGSKSVDARLVDGLSLRLEDIA